MAQQAEPTGAEDRRLYVGIGLTTISYHIYYDEPQSAGYLSTGYFAPVAVNLGYRLNERASIQIGAAYGGSKGKSYWTNINAYGVRTTHHETSRTRALAVPVTGKFIFFQIWKRFPLYGTATLMPSWGFTKYSTSEAKDGGTPTSSTERYRDMNVFATAGIGFSYSFSDRFTGFLEVLPFNYNLTTHNSFDQDWELYSTKGRQLYRSLSLGVNYSL